MSVRGTSRSCGPGPGLRVRYSRNATISAPKNVTSLKMKAAMPTTGARHWPPTTGRWLLLPSGPCATFARSHRGRALVIGGRVTKLYAGGGDDVAHSSVHAFHGLSPAGIPE